MDVETRKNRKELARSVASRRVPPPRWYRALDSAIFLVGGAALWWFCYHAGIRGVPIVLGGVLATLLLFGNTRLRRRGSSSINLVAEVLLVLAAMLDWNLRHVPPAEGSPLAWLVLVIGALLLDLGPLFFLPQPPWTPPPQSGPKLS